MLNNPGALMKETLERKLEWFHGAACQIAPPPVFTGDHWLSRQTMYKLESNKRISVMMHNADLTHLKLV